MKKCNRCLEEKESSCFHKNASAKDGLYSMCSVCSSKYRKGYYAKNKDEINRKSREYHHATPEYQKARNKRYRNTEKGKKQASESHKRWRVNNLHKKVAHESVSQAIKKGNLIKPSKCQICGDEPNKLSGHHHDYEKPLDVVWCCQQCHSNIHKQLNGEMK